MSQPVARALWGPSRSETEPPPPHPVREGLPDLSPVRRLGEMAVVQPLQGGVM